MLKILCYNVGVAFSIFLPPRCRHHIWRKKAMPVSYAQSLNNYPSRITWQQLFLIISTKSLCPSSYSTHRRGAVALPRLLLKRQPKQDSSIKSWQAFYRPLHDCISPTGKPCHTIDIPRRRISLPNVWIRCIACAV